MTNNKKNRKVSIVLTLVLITSLFVGCGKAATDNAYGGVMNSAPQEMFDTKYEYSEEMDAGMAMGNVSQKPSQENPSANNNQQIVSSRKLITTVNVEAETEHYDDLMLWMNARILEYEGYVEYSENYGNKNNRRSSSLTIRVPANNLEIFLSGLSNESNITYQSRSVKDITLNYVDVQSHKEALLVEQGRLMELLTKAENLQDLLKIEERLTEVRYELESYESQLRAYDNKIDYSTIHLSIREVKVLTTPEPEGFFARVSSGFKENLADVTDGIMEFTINFLSNIPTLTVWAVVLLFSGLILRKIYQVRITRKRNKNSTNVEVEKIKKETEKK